MMSEIFGATRFWSITFSKPLPIDTIKNTCGIIPRRVDQKKLETFTLNMHGNKFWRLKGVPPINLKIRRYKNSDFLNFDSKFWNLLKNLSLIISFKKKFANK